MEATCFGYTNKEVTKEFVRKDYFEVGQKLGLSFAGLMTSQATTNQESMSNAVATFKSKIGGLRKPKIGFLRQAAKPCVAVEEEEDSLSSGSESNPSEDNLEPEEL